jgi:hypothetical protein
MKPLLDQPIVDGTTYKQVEFSIRSPDAEWDFTHVFNASGRLMDQQIAKFGAHGAITILLTEPQGKEPPSEWKDQVVRRALVEADGISWDGVLRKARLALRDVRRIRFHSARGWRAMHRDGFSCVE